MSFCIKQMDNIIIIFLILSILIILTALIIYFFVPQNIIPTPVIYESLAKIIGKPQKIPYTIIQTNKNSTVSIYMLQAMKRIINLNPEYNYRYFDDNMCREYISVNYGSEYTSLFDSLKSGAYKADFFRVCYLYKDGGVYIDASFNIVAPLNNLIDVDDEIIFPCDVKSIDGGVGIYNALMICIPQHPILKEYLDSMCYNIKNKLYCKTDLYITGPGCLGLAYRKLYGPLVFGKNNGIKLIKHYHGYIKCNDTIVFYTRYPSYQKEKRPTKHYSSLWKNRKVYKDE